MSFQAYLDNIEAKTGKSPADFKKLAKERGFLSGGKLRADVKAGTQTVFSLGPISAAMAIRNTGFAAQLAMNLAAGPDAAVLGFSFSNASSLRLEIRSQTGRYISLPTEPKGSPAATARCSGPASVCHRSPAPVFPRSCAVRQRHASATNRLPRLIRRSP